MTEQYILEELQKRFKVTKNDIGEDAKMDKGPMHFKVQSYDVEGFGHYCIYDLNGMFGLMKMQTLVLACTQKDLPLFNLDYIKAFGKETQLIELYDTSLNGKAYSEDGFLKVKEAAGNLTDYEAGEHWYDDILLPCSYGKTGKGLKDRFEADCRQYFDLYMEQFDLLPDCDKAAKNEANKGFAQGLLDHGGPAVDQNRKMFGEEKTERLILEHMYGTK